MSRVNLYLVLAWKMFIWRDGIGNQAPSLFKVQHYSTHKGHQGAMVSLSTISVNIKKTFPNKAYQGVMQGVSSFPPETGKS